MTAGPVTRRIELARQIEEMRLLASKQRTELPVRARRHRIPSGIVEERLNRQAAILRTLEFVRDNEAEFRAWLTARRQDA